MRIGLTFLILLFILAVSWAKAWPDFVGRMELVIYDWKTQQFMVNEVDNRITIVEIDERSLKAEGGWPWPREKLARMLHVLKDHYQVSAIGLDVFFPEAKEPVSDAFLADAVTSTRTVLPMVFSQEELTQGILGEAVQVELRNPLATKQAQGYVANGGFFRPNYLAGHISPVVDPDGVIRRFIPVLKYQGQYYEALPMAMVRQLFGIDSLVVERRETISEGYRRWHLNLDEYNDIFLPGLARIPIDRKGESLIPYHHNSGGFNYVSASDILAQRVPMSELLGTIVLIGPTATGLYDLVATPIASQLPGVEIHAHILSALIDGRFLATSDNQAQDEAVVMFLLALIAILFVRNLSPVPIIITMIALGITWFVANLLVWHYIGLTTQMLPPFFYIASLLVMNLVFSLQLSGKQKNRLIKSFERYVPSVVSQASFDQNDKLLEAKKRPITAMFLDLRGFTAWSEQQAAEDVSLYVASVMQEVSSIVGQYGGTIDKYMGDSVMAFWDSKNDIRHAQQAVDAAIAIELHLNKAESVINQHAQPLDYGIGINSGAAMVGQMGTKERASYTVMGDVVNVASRLEALSSAMGCHIILGSETVEQLENIVCKSLGEVNLRGRKNSMSVYTPTIPITNMG